MTPAALLAAVAARGGRLVADGPGLKVRAPAPLPPDLVAALRARKPELLALLAASGRRAAAVSFGSDSDGNAARAGVLGRGGGWSRAEAERRTFEDAVAAWLNAHPPPAGDPDRCAHCGERFRGWEGLPFLRGNGGHVWIHDRCHAAWMRRRRAEAAEALAGSGLAPPAAWHP